MCKLSVIIVNYNVEFFLDQCLNSVFTALNNVSGEVIVVDNNSVDNSVAMVKAKYPQVRIIENKENVGFSKANNQAIREAKGEYILLLNPDTLVQHDTFARIVNFMDQHAEAGGLGVKMIDGKGNFLPESKRGLPTPMVAFYKIFGLTRLFPKSKRFGKYHLTYLDKNQTHEIDVLSGAFMLLRKSVLDKIGLLDEDFFMYGEDIDLSYRMTKAGYKNYYFADTTIIHYKGESTKKGSLNYVVTFYNAMKIFAKKHYSSSKLNFFLFFIQIAIYFRASLSIFKRFFKQTALVLLDFLIITTGFYFITKFWEKNVIFPDGGQYPEMLIFIAIPVYVIVWIFSAFLSGGYDKPVKTENLLKGILSGMLAILIIYSLLDESMRFSRALIIIGSVWSFVYMLIVRYISGMLYVAHKTEKKRFIIVGDGDEVYRVKDILIQSSATVPAFLGFVTVKEVKPKDDNFTGTILQLPDIIRIYNINEVIFCAKNLPASDIITQMSEIQNLGVDMKIAPEESLFIIGSNSINSSEDIYILNINSIDKLSNRRNKRTFDFFVSLFVIILLPVLFFIVKRPFNLLKNIFFVLTGKKSWVGYSKMVGSQQKLPKIKNGILSPCDLIDASIKLNPQTADNLNIIYARDYKISSDLKIMWKGIEKLDR